MGIRDSEIPPRLLRTARFVLIPWRLGWALANKAGWLGEAPVGTGPHLDDAALARWRDELAGARVYLEYGSGGSTVAAMQGARHVVSIDSDDRFLDAVRQKARAGQAQGAVLEAIHIPIGLTELWGRPVFEWPTPGKLDQWRRYTSAPWDYLEAHELVPDFIFVDGRFRAACALESFLRLPAASSTVVMLDDFTRRTKTYGGLLDFADAERVGRALVLHRKKDFDRAACVAALKVHQRDPE